MPQDEVGDLVSPCRQSLTVFLGGVGMRDGYNAEFMDVLRDAGICRPVYGNYAGLWGIADGAGILDMLADAVSVPFGNQPANQAIGLSHADGNSVNDMIRMELEGVLGLTDTRDRLDWQARNQREYDYTLTGVGVAHPAPPRQDQFNLIGDSWGALSPQELPCFMQKVALR